MRYSPDPLAIIGSPVFSGSVATGAASTAGGLVVTDGGAGIDGGRRGGMRGGIGLFVMVTALFYVIYPAMPCRAININRRRQLFHGGNHIRGRRPALHCYRGICLSRLPLRPFPLHVSEKLPGALPSLSKQRPRIRRILSRGFHARDFSRAPAPMHAEF